MEKNFYAKKADKTVVTDEDMILVSEVYYHGKIAKGIDDFVYENLGDNELRGDVIGIVTVVMPDGSKSPALAFIWDTPVEYEWYTNSAGERWPVIKTNSRRKGLIVGFDDEEAKDYAMSLFSERKAFI